MWLFFSFVSSSLKGPAVIGHRTLGNPYESVDPAPPLEGHTLSQLEEILLDESRDLFHRYRALFTLRNLGTDEAVKVNPGLSPTP